MASARAKAAPKKPRIFGVSFASVYPLYVQKVAKKGRTQAEVDAIIRWLTGYDATALRRVLDAKLDLETFFAKAPAMNPNARAITGVVCGVRVEDVEDPLMQKIRWLDKLIDELARGKAMEDVLRGTRNATAKAGRSAAPTAVRRGTRRPSRASRG
jgi:hypothetical protein